MATVTNPTASESFAQNQVVTASFACAEGNGGPGLSSCVGSVANGASIVTSTTGAHQLTVTATSSDGQVGITQVSYSVTAATPPPPAATPASSLYWGALIGSQFTGTEAPWDMNAVTSFEKMAGKNLSVVHFGSPFMDCSTSPCVPYGFPTTAMSNIRSAGAIPFLSWSSEALQSPQFDQNFTLADIISGRYDSYITSFAQGAKAWGHPFFLRFDWEMNGNWYPWSEDANGNQPGQYVAAWRHVHDIFVSVGATNASWVWCPNVDPQNQMTSLSESYPGDSYVDWTGLDGYNFGTNPQQPSGWQTFEQMFSSTYHQITDTLAPSKPMMIGETASSEDGGSKAGWISQMLSELPVSYPKIHGVLWYDRDQGNLDWPLETSPAAISGFAAGIQNTAYVSNNYSNLNTSPIPAP